MTLNGLLCAHEPFSYRKTYIFCMPFIPQILRPWCLRKNNRSEILLIVLLSAVLVLVQEAKCQN